ncbi:hypothetical protein QOZ96_003603 [Brevundimonas nasdae]|uniref:hypothetical protein n=1 Tax=Brevundimonas nasdae TaxID=172043 RepID=UPI00191299C2|nr:hypothetical protein [Brevundimonas nasdae]MBK6024542.1 hypothetical protein [Brevundimonas nasdae]MDQ0453630.1 hypothetical protein [Brevundimonas nasdae]
MGEALSVARDCNISECEFWKLTPYDLISRVKSHRRNAAIGYLYTGWFAERFAREERLQGPQTYIDQFFREQSPAEVDAPDPVMFHRMAQDWGLEIEPYSE